MRLAWSSSDIRFILHAGSVGLGKQETGNFAETVPTTIRGRPSETNLLAS